MHITDKVNIPKFYRCQGIFYQIFAVSRLWDHPRAMTFRADRLKARMSAAGLNQRSLAIKAGLHQDRVRNILRGISRNPRADTVEALADALGVAATWLLGRDESAFPLRHTGAVEIADPMTTIPELDARAGGGEEPDDQGPARIADWGFPAIWLVGVAGPGPSHIHVIEVQGNSMEPSLSPGDKVVVDRGQTEPSPPGYFVLRDGSGIVVKQIEHVPDSKPPRVTVKSVNRDYGTCERRIDKISIIGRVVAAIRRV